MTIAANLLQALVLGCVASLIHSLISGNRAWIQWLALAAALTLVAWAIWSGPFKLG